MTAQVLDQLSINMIRTLSMDAVQQAGSGHPGIPMALAPLAYTLWNRVMRFDPQDSICGESSFNSGVLLFNILHGENPVELLRRAAESLRSNGQAFVIHWRYGDTLRSPSLAIRPRPDQIVRWAAHAHLQPIREPIELPPWHFGLSFRLAATSTPLAGHNPLL